MSWIDDLEARLESELERFLAANPDQDALLQDQEDRDRRSELQAERRSLQSQAERQRQGLLQIASEIRQWQERSRKAQGAGAGELAERAAAHVDTLMQQGRSRWQELAELGRRFGEVEAAIAEVRARQPRTPRPTSAADLEREWAAFEADQELERLRRRQG